MAIMPKSRNEDFVKSNTTKNTRKSVNNNEQSQMNKIKISNDCLKCECGAILEFSLDTKQFLMIPKPIRIGWYKHYHEKKSLRQSAEDVGLPLSTLFQELRKYGLSIRNKKQKRK